MAENPAESSKAAKSFHFVPADGPSSHARQRGKPAAQEYAKEARRHVMRHIGHAKRNGRPPKRRTYERYELHWAGGEQVDSDAVALPVLDAPNLGDLAAGAAQYLDLDDGQVVARSDPHLPDLARSLGSGRLDPFLAYPFALSQQALRLLDYMLDPRVVILRSFRVTWYPLLGLGDAAVFNQCLSNTCSGIGKLLDIPSLFEDEANRYHAAALESVNSRINDPRHVGDDGILASVIGFAFHTEQTRRASSWSMHIRGLQGIVEARGGIDTGKLHASFRSTRNLVRTVTEEGLIGPAYGFQGTLIVPAFEIEFTEIHWHTVYGTQQHVAARFQDRERILLAGDAAHTHSSGSAQGMNTGMHDVSHLSWRLAGVLKGWYKPEVLATYTLEWHASATQLINTDKLISALISNKKPESMKDREEDCTELLDEVMQSQSSFSNGLGIAYAPNLLSNVYRNGKTRQPIRLFEVTKYNAKFRIIVFAGVASSTRPQLQALRIAVDDGATRFQHAVEFLSIIAGVGQAFEEHLGVPPFGKPYWDITHDCTARYDINVDRGAIAVLRPNGLLVCSADMDGFDKVLGCLERLIVPREVKAATNGHTTRQELGEFKSQNESDLAMPEDGGVSSRESGVVVG
ncbi:hypothetical protein LTR53_009440 [Teratosphaeriaceae sp. CCFEE 6253]|nr:hypothetical protein LTR53_009440 [Teratosphaeriaceae sp. CCFEE 6253]